MRTLSSESFTRIVPILRENYGNLLARISLKLPPETSEIFAQFTMKPSTNSAEWTVNEVDDHEYRPIAEANEDERQKVSLKIKEAKEAMQKSLVGEIADVENLLYVPNENCIFFRTLPDGNIKVALTQWGFRNIKQGQQTDIIQLMLDRVNSLKQTDVNLNIKYSNGKIVSDKELVIDISGNKIPFKTSSSGTYAIGKVVVGKHFRIISDNGSSDDILVEADKTNYDVTINIGTTYCVKVVNQENTPKANFQFNIDGVPVTTDHNGEYHSSPITLIGNKSIHVEAPGQTPADFNLSANAEENKFIYNVIDQFECSLTVNVIRSDGQPVADCKVNLTGEGFNQQYITNNSGTFSVGPLSYGMNIHVETADRAASADVTINKGKNDCTLIIPVQPPKLVKINIKNSDGSPICNTPMKISLSKGTLDCVTNAEGYVLIDASCFNHGETVNLSFSYTKPSKKKK